MSKKIMFSINIDSDCTSEDINEIIVKYSESEAQGLKFDHIEEKEKGVCIRRYTAQRSLNNG